MVRVRDQTCSISFPISSSKDVALMFALNVVCFPRCIIADRYDLLFDSSICDRWYWERFGLCPLFCLYTDGDGIGLIYRWGPLTMIHDPGSFPAEFPEPVPGFC